MATLEQVAKFKKPLMDYGFNYREATDIVAMGRLCEGTYDLLILWNEAEEPDKHLFAFELMRFAYESGAKCSVKQNFKND